MDREVAIYKSEKKALFSINVIYNIIGVYFDTFFVFYFFQVANYEIIPLAKYYLTFYLTCGIGFFLIRNAMKSNIKVPYFRIGISLEAIFIALIMLLKGNIINYIYLAGVVSGLADSFFYFPKNILETEKISNEERQKYSGIVNTINKISAIIVPLIMGVLLTFMTYVNLGKIVFLLFIVLFIVSFFIDDKYHLSKKSDLKGFIKIIKENKNIKRALTIPLLSGFTYSSGVMALIITLSKINVFKTNLNLGFTDSACALIFLITCLLFGLKIKKEKFSILAYISGIVGFIILIIYAFNQTIIFLIIYLFIRNSFIGLINLITNNTVNNLTNSELIRNEYKSEFFLIRDLMFSVSRCCGYLLLLVVSFYSINYIYYLLIIPAVSLLIEGIIIGKLNK